MVEKLKMCFAYYMKASNVEELSKAIIIPGIIPWRAEKNSLADVFC